MIIIIIKIIKYIIITMLVTFCMICDVPSGKKTLLVLLNLIGPSHKSNSLGSCVHTFEND